MQDIMIMIFLAALLGAYYLFSGNTKVARSIAYILIIAWFLVLFVHFFTGLSAGPRFLVW
jgi:hypothetical protein